MVVAYEGYCKIFRVGIVEVVVTSSILFLNVSKFWSAISILENIIFRYKFENYGNVVLWKLCLNDVNGSWRIKLFEIVLIISWFSTIESEYNKLNFICLIQLLSTKFSLWNIV